MGNDYRTRKTLMGKDYFPTYHALTKLLLEKIKGLILPTDMIYEPCAGNGDISKILEIEYPKNIICSLDLNPLSSNIMQGDFLKSEGTCDYIITNPPYNIFSEFYKKALSIFTKGMFVLLPLDYLHGIERYDNMYTNNILKTVYVFVRRPLFSAKYHPAGLMPTGATTFAWYYFDKGYMGLPHIEWLDNRKFMGKPTLITDDRINKKIGFL